jgi:hypothetical protein
MAKLFLVPIDLGKLEIRNAVVQNLGSAPGSPVEGQIYYDTTAHKLYWRSNSAWVAAEPGSFSYATTAELVNVDAAAEGAGASATVARGDHKHALTVGSPVGVGTSNADGTADSAARSDHVHLARSHDHSSSTDGTSLAPATLIAPASTSPAQTAEGSIVWDSDDDLLTVGTGAGRRIQAYIGSSTPTTQAVGDSAVVGTSNEAARVDHKHALFGFGSVTAETTFGTSSSNGSAGTVAHSDHAHGNPTHVAADHSAIKLSDLAAPTSDVSMNSHKITNLQDPSSPQDAASKAYVDLVATGLDAKQSVRVATTVAGTLASSFENGDTVDGVALVTGDRILIKDQASGSENGIWVVAASGSPTRAVDADSWAELISAFTFVEEGTTNADSGWVSTVNAGGTLNTTSITFVQFSGAGQITAGAGLTKTGNTLNVGAGTGIVVNTDDVQVRRDGTNNAHVPLLFAQSVGDGSSTSITVTHNLGTKDVLVQVWDNTAPYAQVEVDVEHASTTTITVKFAVAPTTNQYRVTIFG